MEYSQKIKAIHLMRKAVDYVRQSTMKQVYENSESTRRQYALKERLIQLGWQPENIMTIDCDLGMSGSGSAEREGFIQLGAAVGNNEVGVIACLEMSRLARNSQEWCRLMEICSITQTILIDADGVYDLNDFNDRMLLGLKGTMSEAELHLIRARLRGGALSKAKRGEYRTPLPIGYVYDEAGRVIKDPNIEVQSAVNLFFETFRMCGSASRMVRQYTKNSYKIPTSPANGFGCKELLWVKLSSTRALDILHNPAYAGIYAYGQHQVVPTINGKKVREKPVDEWHVLLKGHHEEYISEDEFHLNQARLLENNTHYADTPPTREGNALLQGLTMCGVCGRKMGVQYHGSKRENTPYYVCDDDAKHNGGTRCQYVHGAGIDSAVSGLILERLTPVAIANALKIKEEVKQRESASDNYFVLQLERARYDANVARTRYMNVDPLNRLVAFELEKIWNQKITDLARAEEELRLHECAKDKAAVQPDISELMSIPDNVKDIWNNGNVQVKDKKRIIRCLVEDVTITKNGQVIRLGVRFKTGTTAEIECLNPPMSYTTWTTSDEVIDIIRRGSLSHTREEIAEILKNEGYFSGKGLPFSVDRVGYIMRVYNISSYQDHLKARGYLNLTEKAHQLNVSPVTVHKWKNTGLLDCDYIKTSGKGDYMFAPQKNIQLFERGAV
jgi:DNA invertase Pin-like site-specific DNA recombinase